MEEEMPGRASHPTHEKFRLLVAEDEEIYTLVLQKAVRNAGLAFDLYFVRNGLEVKGYLSGDPPYDDRQKYPLPSMLLLDLNMPLVDGFEVLKWLRCIPRFKRLVVVMHSASSSRRDVNRAYELGANGFVVKKADAAGLSELVNAFDNYWRCTNVFATITE